MENVKLLKELGILIKKYRKKNYMSQEELGFEIGSHKNQVSCIERGLKNIKFSTLVRIISVLSIPIEDLNSFKYEHINHLPKKDWQD